MVARYKSYLTITNDVSQLTSITPYHGSNQMTIGNGQFVPTVNEGWDLLPTPLRKFQLSHIFHAHQLFYNLLYVNKFTHENDLFISFNTNGYVIKDKRNNCTILHGASKNGFYQVLMPSNLPLIFPSYKANSDVLDISFL